MLGNSENSYGLVSRAIHGIMLLLIFGMIGVGMYMTELDKSDDLRKTLYAMHISTGILVFMLAVVRVLWLKMSPAPKLPLGLSDQLLGVCDHKRDTPDPNRPGQSTSQ